MTLVAGEPRTVDGLPGYTGQVADGCEDPRRDAARLYAWTVYREVGGFGRHRPAKPCRRCRWSLGRSRAEAREGADPGLDDGVRHLALVERRTSGLDRAEDDARTVRAAMRGLGWAGRL